MSEIERKLRIIEDTLDNMRYEEDPQYRWGYNLEEQVSDLKEALIKHGVISNPRKSGVTLSAEVYKG